jgi:sialate O-acetylesterase
MKKSKRNQSIIVLLLLMVFNLSLFANVKPAQIFSSNMVLQNGTKIPVWGWADKGEKIMVTLAGTTIETTAGEDGKWMVKFDKMEYGGPHTMTIHGDNTITFKNVMIGEVWICSGQSNMEFQLIRSINGAEEVANSNHANIRLFKVPRKISQSPEKDMDTGEWQICSPQTSKNFSAVGYFFGRALSEDLDVPIGLIQSALGGTVAESWTSGNTMKNDPDFKEKYNQLIEMDVAAEEQRKVDEIKKVVGGELPPKDKGVVDGKWKYAAPNFDDSKWERISIAKVWDKQGYSKIDGVACYRKTFTLSKKQAGNSYELHLGKIDDSDITWVNGVKVGETKRNSRSERDYTIPAKVLKKGKNVIAVRVSDGRGVGGFYDSEKVSLVGNGENIDIPGDWKIKFTVVSLNKTKFGPNSYPTLLYNGMINPLIPYAIKGVIWYQGESNAKRAKQYGRIFPNMITDWRTNWNDDDFPFLFVSLANFKKVPEQPGESSWAELRESQTKALKLKVTGMALAIDLGVANNIHPKNKQDVGKRLELAALNKGYRKPVIYSGPMYQSMKVADNKIEIEFTHFGCGLTKLKRSKEITGFSIAGADKKFHWAKAKIIDKNRVEVWCNEVKEPVAVRYGWADNPGFLNLYNNQLLPANPFRTDDWEGITK